MRFIESSDFSCVSGEFISVYILLKERLMSDMKSRLLVIEHLMLSVSESTLDQ